MENNYIKEKVIIDCSILLKTIGELFPHNGEPLEYDLIRGYKFKQDNNYIVNFTKKLLNIIYNDDIEHNYTDILTFYEEKQYLTNINKFVSMLISVINRNVDIDYIDVYFNKFINMGKKSTTVIENDVEIKRPILLVEFIVVRKVKYG